MVRERASTPSAASAAEMASRVRKLRASLDRSQRATDAVTSIVTSTDARLSELHDLMAPIQDRTQALTNAREHLTRCVSVVGLYSRRDAS